MGLGSGRKGAPRVGARRSGVFARGASVVGRDALRSDVSRAVSHTYRLLDLTPRGRDEDGLGMKWVRHHDRYEQMPTAR
jgi:predicted dithiol-disulfide oxidoreductase (DUF899 family)